MVDSHLYFGNARKKRIAILFSDTVLEFAKCPGHGARFFPSNVWRNGKSLKNNGTLRLNLSLTFHKAQTFSDPLARCPFPLSGKMLSVAFRGVPPNIVVVRE